MKPCNFPERKNRRRKGALARLQTSLAEEPETTDYKGVSHKTNRTLRMESEIAILEKRVVDTARDVRTKKFRG